MLTLSTVSPIKNGKFAFKPLTVWISMMTLNGKVYWNGWISKGITRLLIGMR